MFSAEAWPLGFLNNPVNNEGENQFGDEFLREQGDEIFDSLMMSLRREKPIAVKSFEQSLVSRGPGSLAGTNLTHPILQDVYTEADHLTCFEKHLQSST